MCSIEAEHERLFHTYQHLVHAIPHRGDEELLEQIDESRFFDGVITEKQYTELMRVYRTITKNDLVAA